MYQVTGSALDQDEAIIANRVKSIQDQYAMVNELAAQAPMGIQSLHRPVEVPGEAHQKMLGNLVVYMPLVHYLYSDFYRSPPPNTDVAPDPFYSSDAIRSTINTVSTHSHTLSTKYSDLFSQDDVSSLVRRAFDNPSLVTGSKKRLSTSASGSARRRPEKVEVTRKQKQDLELANAPLEFPTFKSVYDEDIAKPVTPERSEADEVSEHKKSKPPPMKRANSDSSEDKPHPKKLPTSTKVHTIYRGKSKPNNNKGRVVSPSSEETAKKKKKKTGKVAFGSTVKKTKDVIGRAEIKARKIGDTANEVRIHQINYLFPFPNLSNSNNAIVEIITAGQNRRPRRRNKRPGRRGRDPDHPQGPRRKREGNGVPKGEAQRETQSWGQL